MKTAWAANEIELVAAVDPLAGGEDIGILMGMGSLGLKVEPELDRAFEQAKPDVMVDFTTPQTVFNNTILALKHQVRPVVGTTGLSSDEIAQLKEISSASRLGCIVAPNFAIGALLMMRFAADVCKYLPYVEIIEMHHDQKLDAPSGTAIKTAEIINAKRGNVQQGSAVEVEKIPGSRGGDYNNGIRIHSVRLPGLVAHQELIFGGVGETLTIRHDSISRESFMPGVLLAVRKVMELQEMVYGLENILLD